MHFYMENFWRVFNRHQDCRPKASPWGRMRAGELVESEQGRSSEHCVSQETCWRWCNSFSDPLDPFSVPWCYYGDRWLRRQGGDVFSIVFLYIFFKRYFNDSLSNEYVYWTFRQLAQICAGNFLECLNLALNHFDQHHLDRLLRVSGQALQGANEGLGKSPNLQFQFMFFQSTLQPMIHILFSDWYLKDQLSFSCSTEACTTGGGHHDCWLRFWSEPEARSSTFWPIGDAPWPTCFLCCGLITGWHANYCVTLRGGDNAWLRCKPRLLKQNVRWKGHA